MYSENKTSGRAGDPLAPADLRDDELGEDYEELALNTPSREQSIFEEIGSLIDDAKTYLQAEVGFQKTRGKLAGREIGKAIAFAAIALVTLHIALLALAVGLVIALTPVVSIWGAIAIVVGVLLVITAWVGLKAKSRGSKAASLFSSGGKS